MLLIFRRFALKPLLLATFVASFAVLPASAQATFQVGLQDQTLSGIGSESFAAPGYTAVSAIGGSIVRVNAVFAAIAGPTPFNLSNPSDPHYRWAHLDQAVRRAAARHLQMLFMFYDAPVWAEGPGAPPATDQNVGPGAWEPNPILFGQYVRAVAQRYSGSTPDPLNPGIALPRVANYEIWNEPNLSRYIAGPNRVGQFRAMLGAGYNAVKSVNRSNNAVLGGLAPISPQGTLSSHPLSFLEQLFCVRRGRKHWVRTGGCAQKVRFDALGVHPYSLAATPTKPALDPNDMLVHDVYKVGPIIKAGEKLHTINSGRHPIWNTEWAWFTDPPQTQYGDPEPAAARYVAYSMYSMWKAGVTAVIWQVLTDVLGGPNPGGGLETGAGLPKLTMTAFSFPFIASVNHRKGYGWGRAPVRSRVTVYVQHLVRGQWRQAARARTDGYGVFQVHFKARGNGTYRAQVAKGGFSVPYFSKKIPPARTHPYAFG
jgi:hypothetical protein